MPNSMYDGIVRRMCEMGAKAKTPYEPSVPTGSGLVRGRNPLPHGRSEWPEGDLGLLYGLGSAVILAAEKMVGSRKWSRRRPSRRL